MYAARILADSLVKTTRKRLTTIEATYPRMVHSELMTHRLFSRNSASSRAIPIEKMLERIVQDPVLPVWWGKNQKGMQAQVELEGEEREIAQKRWLDARDQAVLSAHTLLDAGLHKQIVNRVVEPWMWITVIISATEWTNFFELRCHKDAQPEIRHIAEWMERLYTLSQPQELEPGDWHTPLVQPEDDGLSTMDIVRLCTARCARVSYLTHDGKRDPAADFELHDRLVSSGHWSPFEHCAMALDRPDRCGNFIGFKQYRKLFENEHRGGRMP